MVLRFAWRNVWRQRRRTVLTIAAIGFASFLLVFMVAVQYSTYAIAVENTLRVFPGAMQVQRDGYLDDRKIDLTIANPERLREAIAERLDAGAIAIRAEGLGLASSRERSRGVQVFGVEPDREGRVSTIPELVGEGRFLQGEQAREAVVGDALARALKVDPGSELTFLGQGKHGALAATTLKVVGVFDSGSRELDRGLVEIPLDTFRDVFGLRDEAHSIVISDVPLARIDRIEARVHAVLPGAADLRVVPWEQLVPGLERVIALDQAAAWVMYVVLVVVVVLSILTAFLMAVIERTREFGVMRAIGMSRGRVSRLILLETLLLVLLGVGIGTVAGALAVEYFHIYGLPIPGAGHLAAQFNLPAVIHPRLDWLSAVGAPAIVLVLTMLGALYPVARIRGVQPIDAMRAL